MRTAAGIAAAGAAAVVAFVLMIAVIVASNNQDHTGPGGQLATGSVPASFTPWVQRAGALCPQVGAPLLAAQLQQESNFNPAAVSVAGAQGAAQFLPGTWPSWGRDDDGNGVASPFDIADAVMAQGRYMCALASQMAQALAAGRVQGSVQDLALAAYNAGPGAVLATGGIPRNGETDAYVARINAALPRFGATTAPGQPGQPAPEPATAPAQPMAPNDGSFASNVILAGQRWIGQPYVWGGGDTAGPTRGGFDCSGLTVNAVYAASGGAISLPHNAAQQATLGAPVNNNQLRPGDLLFFASSPAAAPHHVGIYIGGARMLDAPDFGKTVTVTGLDSPYYRTQTITARRFG
jgi:cell wall-associated NlpC family hydrolase